jgi:3-methyladenine DNA glycosylase/8-oxoguanine DNA glycosylase
VSKVSTPTDVARALSRYRPLRPVITEAGPPPRRRAWPVTQRYAYLVRSIVYQQLAGSAAQAILARVEAQLPAQYSPTDVLAALDGPLLGGGALGRQASGDR